jgi:hypothetical protein
VFSGVGTSSTPYLDTVAPSTADLNFEGVWVKSTAATGTTRGQYWRLYLTGGAGGECIRAFTTIENDTPADTVNGAHISLNFGSSDGNVTGLGTAVRGTLHIPDRSLGGTTTAIQAELWADGSSSALGGTTSFIRCVAGGDQTGIDEIDDDGFFFEATGLTSGSTHMFLVGAPVTLAASLKCKVGAVTYYLPLYSAQA